MAVEAKEILRRLKMLRSEMEQNGIDVLILVSTDPHASEYVHEHDKVTEYFSGCTSDNVTMIVEKETARLWTDGRYFISAAAELKDTGIMLMKMGQEGVPDVTAYLESVLEKGMTLGYDGRTVPAEKGRRFRKAAGDRGARVDMSFAPADRLWIGRPALPCHSVRVLSAEMSGLTFAEKLALVEEKMRDEGAMYLVLSKLDDIMWLLNIRGSDIECCPVALSYLLIGPGVADLFIQSGEVTDEFAAYAKERHIKIHEYGTFYEYLSGYHFEGDILCDSRESSDAVMEILRGKADVIDRPNPTALLKALKNPVEIANIRRTYVEDSVAVCRFICRMKHAEEPMTEMDAVRLMDSLRGEIPGFLGVSFPTISAYGPNAAMAHYTPSEDGGSVIRKEGFLLVDSGGQYEGGTTDVTRTIAMGPLTGEMKRDFTLVAAANLRLLEAKFISGTTGSQLDMIPREVLYRYGMDYNHGTGHGIGYALNVHEGPQSISKSSAGGRIPVGKGMVISDEPGIYKEDRYGIRTESIVVCEEDGETEFGSFLRFEPLTFVPIDLEALDPAYMEESDIERLNKYHKTVWSVISPYLEGEELEYLREATRAFS